MLDQKLLERQARETGLCPVREELFSECFDELIRQVTLDEPTRGMLLFRVREDIRKTNESYQTLYQSSVTFAMRKQLQAEHGMEKLETTITDLEDEKMRQNNRVQEITTRIEAAKIRSKERKVADKKRQEEEFKFLNFQMDHLHNFSKQIEDK